MEERDRRNAYEDAMHKLENFIHRDRSGLFFLELRDASQIDIDPVVFADLKRSLEQTNRKIQAGEIAANVID